MTFFLLLFDDDGHSYWESTSASDLLDHIEAESSHFFGLPVAFRDEYGDEFWKLCSLQDEDGDFAGAIVRRISDGFIYSTTDCETWTLASMPKRVRTDA